MKPFFRAPGLRGRSRQTRAVKYGRRAPWRSPGILGAAGHCGIAAGRWDAPPRPRDGTDPDVEVLAVGSRFHLLRTGQSAVRDQQPFHGPGIAMMASPI